MKLTYLGTAAAEGFPAVFCNCEYCQKARESKDRRNLRTRSQALINDDLLIDLPADTMAHFHQNNIRGDKIKYIIITHSHNDHFYDVNLDLHGSCYAHNMQEEKLHVFGSDVVYARLEGQLKRMKKSVAETIEIHKAEPYKTEHIGGYEITPLPARHAGNELAVFYIIKEQNKVMLYAHDTGYFYHEVFEYIEKSGIKFDLVSLDCTNAHLPSSPVENHMGFDNNERVIKILRSIGAVSEETKLFVNHFSHNGNPLHEDMLISAARIGCGVSYDGCKVEI